MKQKLFQSKKTLPWAGTLDVTFDPKLCIDDEENDLEREATMYVNHPVHILVLVTSKQWTPCRKQCLRSRRTALRCSGPTTTLRR